MTTLVTLLLLLTMQVKANPHEKPSNDMMPSRLDRGDLILQHAMAYEFLGTPTQARQILWLHLPLDITALIDAADGLITIASELQNTCDAALIATVNRENEPTTTASPIDTARANMAEEIAQDEFQWLWQYDPTTLPEIKAACEKHNMLLPTPARHDKKYKKRLNEFMTHNQIEFILIESVYSQKDHMNRLPPDMQIPTHAFPASRKEKANEYSPKEKKFVTSKFTMDGYNDDADVTFAYKPNGKITAFFSPADEYWTYEKLMKLGMTRQEISAGDHIVKQNVICERSEEAQEKEKHEKRLTSTVTKPESRGYHETVQLCYDSVDQIEYRGVKEYLQLNQVFSRYNLVHNARRLPTNKTGQDTRRQKTKDIYMRDQEDTQTNTTTTKEESKRNNTYEKEKEKETNTTREKRMIPAIALRGALQLGKMIGTRVFASKIAPFVAHSGIRNIAPGRRRAASLLKHITPFLKSNPIPILMGVSGIGHSIWRNYKTNKKFEEQLKIIQENRRRIEAQATELGTVKLEVIENYDTLNAIKIEMFKTQEQLQSMYNTLNIVAATQILQKTLLKVTQETNIIAEDTQIQYNNLVEILLSVSSDTIPGVFLPEIKAKANVLGLSGDQMLPNPERAVSISPLVEKGKINIYANFITGERKWEMYKIISIPRFSNGQSFTTETEFNYALVGKAQGQFMPLTNEEARACKMGACDPTGIVKRINDDNCTIKMIALSAPNANCPVKTSQQTPYFKSTINGLIYSVPTNTVGRLHCPNRVNLTKIGIDEVIELKGMGIYDIPTGCDFRINDPEVIVLGPPKTIHEGPIANGRLKLQSSSTANKNQTFSTHRQEQRAIRSEQSHMQNQIKITKTQIGKYAAITIIIIAIVTALLLIATGKLVWLTIIHKKVKKTYHASKEAVATGKTAIATGFSSLVKHADAVNALLLNRQKLNKYLKGDTNSIPLKRHISLINLENGEKENRLLGENVNDDDGDSDDDENRHKGKYPYLPPLREHHSVNEPRAPQQGQ